MHDTISNMAIKDFLNPLANKTFKKSFKTLKNQRFLVPGKSGIFSEINQEIKMENKRNVSERRILGIFKQKKYESIENKTEVSNYE